MRWICWDESGCKVEIEADTAEEAAEAYVAEGDYPQEDRTYWINVYVLADEDEDHPEVYKVEAAPVEPPCTGLEHDWQSPHRLVGGLRENPGVFGHGGGVLIHEVCSCCGAWRTTDTWAQDHQDGVQGLRAVNYRKPDHFAEDYLEPEDYDAAIAA